MNLEQRITAIIARNLEKKQPVTPGQNLREDLEVDSLGVIMIINDIENEFKIVIDENDFTGLVTVGDVIAAMRTRYNLRD